jgi:signal peptide peptidase SppA
MLPDLLALDPATWTAMQPTLERYAAGAAVTREEAASRLPAPSRSLPRGPGAVAVVPLVGLLTHRDGGLLAFLFGGTNLEAFTRDVRQAAADPGVSTLVVLADSPGGEVAGTPEAAEALYEARAHKRVVTVVEGMMASAALWIGAQAHEVIASPSSQLGSVGVLCVHTDLSEAARQAGIKRTIIASSPRKTEGNSFEPLSADARADIQGRVDTLHRMFVAALARGRNVPASTVESDFGEGRVLLAADAVKRHMADRLGTLESALGGIVGTRSAVSASAAARRFRELTREAALSPAQAELQLRRRRFELHAAE